MRKAARPRGRAWLEERLGEPLPLVEIAGQTTSEDARTRKYLLRLVDGQEIETVIMGYPGRFTACISTQAGCAMGCVFCATGQMGFVRHLSASEMLMQIDHVRAVLESSGEQLRNLVLMGMGEPLHNYEPVMLALDLCCDSRGFGVAPRHVTINTVGVVPGILRMAEERRPYHLGVSLHGASDEERGRLVPVNQRWPLASLLEACRHYCRARSRRIFFSWTLIDGVNDCIEHAARLVELLGDLDAHVNLICLNPTPGYAGREGELWAADAFRAHLQQAGIPCTIRQKRGIDVAAGCGQLTTSRQLLKPRRSTRPQLT